MIKFRNFLIILIVLIILFSCCTVNSSMGLITVTNSSDQALTNVMIGSTLIVSYLAAGTKFDYWTAFTIQGKTSADNFKQGDLASVTYGPDKWGYVSTYKSQVDNNWYITGYAMNQPNQ